MRVRVNHSRFNKGFDEHNSMREAHVDGPVIVHVSQRHLPMQVARKLSRQRIGVDRAAIAEYTSLKYSEYDNKAVRDLEECGHEFRVSRSLGNQGAKVADRSVDSSCCCRYGWASI
jgi:hypothetical protein